MANKYQSYSIQVKYHNGDNEKIEILNETEVDNTSYKEMLKVYNEIKDTYKDKNCDIEFCGSSENGCFDVMFTKEYKNTIDIKEIEKTNIYGEETTEELIESLNNIMMSLKERKEYLPNFMGMLDKKTDVYLHQLENKETLGLSDTELLKLCDEISAARIQRRNLKSEISLSCIVNHSKIIDNIDNLIKSTGIKLNKIEMIHENIDNTLKNGGTIKSLKIDEFQYKNFEDRMRIMKQIQSSHERVTYDIGKKMVYGYKKCSCNK